MKNISELIAQKSGYKNLVDELNERLSGSELNSLLIELFRKRVKTISPAELLRQFKKNRFAAPSSIDPIPFREFELRCLRVARDKNFKLVTLSPLAPLGTCSVTGFVDQNNVVSAVRGTEVVADATNVFALLIASNFNKKNQHAVVRYAAAQRHVRSQALSNPAFTPHFGIFCLATGGLDTGDFSFELKNLEEHIGLHLAILSNELGKDNLSLKILLKGHNEVLHGKLKPLVKKFSSSSKIEIVKEMNHTNYYNFLQFRFYFNHNGEEINLSDGGFVDWTQKLIANKKHRLLISGLGTDLIYKIKESMA